MEHTNNLFCEESLESGELYLFHESDSSCPAESSLWGVVDCCDKGSVVLESYTLDQRFFVLWGDLPPTYRHCRLATRGELRDYAYNIALYESGANAEVRSNLQSFEKIR